MWRRTKRNILLSIVAIIMALIGYKVWNKPHVNIENAIPVKITAINLYDGLSKNDSITNSICLNKILEVSGEIDRFTFNQQHQQIILLKTNIPGGAVNCTMEEKIDDVRPGEKIVLKGICSGYIGGNIEMGLPGDVFLMRCHSFH